MSQDQIVAAMSEQWALTVAQLALLLRASNASAKRRLRRDLRRLQAAGVVKPADHDKPTAWVLELPGNVRRWIDEAGIPGPTRARAHFNAQEASP